MRVFLTGGSGFIGGHVLRALSERGHEVTCLLRGEAARGRQARALPGTRVVEGEFTRPETWLRHVSGHDTVVNAVGIIREAPGSRFETVHADAPIALFEAAAEAGLRKIVQISAMGADEGAASRFHLSKRAADRRLAGLGVPYVVLRPSQVYGPGDHSMSFFRSLAALPVTPVPGDGQSLLQPVHVQDVTRAVLLAVEQEGLHGLAVDLGGAETVTLDALLDALARRLGKRRARKLHLPWSLMRLVAAVTDALGGRGPITREELGMLRRGNAGDNGPFIRRFGFRPMALEEGLTLGPQ
jgi:NADH dehydrogenase